MKLEQKQKLADPILSLLYGLEILLSKLKQSTSLQFYPSFFPTTDDEFKEEKAHSFL